MTTERASLVHTTGADAVTRQEALSRAQALRAEFQLTAADVDLKGECPRENLARIHQEGLSRLLLPAEYGGIASDGSMTADADILMDMLTELSAGESSTAQIYSVHTVETRMIFGGLLQVPDETKRQLAREILEDGALLCNSAAEAGKQRRDYKTIATPISGGLRISGVKLFNTGSESARYTLAPVLLDGYESVEEGGLTFVLIPLDAKGVRLHRDWDNMGQRATGSGGISFDEVMVPDRYHFPVTGGGGAFYQQRNITGPFLQMALSAVILGMGLGAFDLTLDYVRKYARPNSPAIARAADDPLARWHVGRFSAMLAAARALQREAAVALTLFEQGRMTRQAASVHMMRSKYLSNEAALTAAGELHRLAGGRATANKHRLDRFWRNARTLSVHDSLDGKLQQIGDYELNAQAPPASFIS